MKNAEKTTQINCAYTSTEPVKVERVAIIPDLYVFFKEQEEKGLFRVKPRNGISGKEIDFVYNELKKDIKKNGLKNLPDHPMSVFIQRHFPGVWGAADFI